MIKNEIVADSCHQKVEDVATDIGDEKQRQNLPECVILRPRVRVDIWCKHVLVSHIQNDVHFVVLQSKIFEHDQDLMKSNIS